MTFQCKNLKLLPDPLVDSSPFPQHFQKWGLFESEIQPRTQAKDPYLILVRIQCRVDDKLNVRSDGEMRQQVEPIVEFRRILVPQVGAEGLFRGGCEIIEGSGSRTPL